MMFVDIPYKYLGLIPITYENIKKVNCIIFFFFDLTVEQKTEAGGQTRE